MEMSKGNIKSAIRDGLDEGDVFIANKEKAEEMGVSMLNRAFEAASRIVEGLKILGNEENSTFTFSSIEESENAIRIVTNLKKNSSKGDFSLFIDGGSAYDSYDSPSKIQEVLKKIAKNAKQQGLVP